MEILKLKLQDYGLAKNCLKNYELMKKVFKVLLEERTGVRLVSCKHLFFYFSPYASDCNSGHGNGVGKRVLDHHVLHHGVLT